MQLFHIETEPITSVQKRYSNAMDEAIRRKWLAVVRADKQEACRAFGDKTELLAHGTRPRRTLIILGKTIHLT